MLCPEYISDVSRVDLSSCLLMRQSSFRKNVIFKKSCSHAQHIAATAGSVGIGYVFRCR